LPTSKTDVEQIDVKIITTILMAGVIGPAFAVPWLMGELLLHGYTKHEAVVMTLGYLTPIAFAFLLVLWIVERRQASGNRQIGNS
jgi:hypothetical protein